MTPRNAPEKQWYESKTVIGGIVAVVSGVAAAFGIAISPEDQEQIVAAVAAIGSAVGGALAIYGRIKASKPISGSGQ